MTIRRRGRSIVLACLGFAGVLGSSLNAPAVASQVADEGTAGDVVVTDARIESPVPGDRVSRHLWTWPEANLGYLVDAVDSQLVAVDLETGEVRARKTVFPRIYAAQDNGAESSTTEGTALNTEVIAVDRQGGTLLVAYELADQAGAPVTAPGTAQFVGEHTQRALRGQVCLRHVGGGVGCFSGINVVDARTLEVQKAIPYTTAAGSGTLDGHLLAMRYSPPIDGISGGGKVHAIVYETYAQSSGDASVRHRTATNVMWLVEFDIAAGRQTWAVRLDACRGDRKPADYAAAERVFLQPFKAALMRRGGAEPAVLVGCYASSTQQGAIVEVPLDARGYPFDLPASVNVPEKPSPSGALEEEPRAVAFPPAQRVALGPDRVTQIISDPASGRMALRVHDGNPKAEVWWIFNTDTFQFAGTIGIGRATLPAANLTGFDPDKGRLYVMPLKGGGGRPALYAADIRRSPVAQALVYEEVGWLAPQAQRDLATRSLGVASAAGGQPTRIYVPDSVGASFSAYTVVEDRRAEVLGGTEEIGGMPSLDISEEVGVTESNLDGAARGYGARMLLVGGLEAAVRAGPADPIGVARACSEAGWIAALSSPCLFAHQSLGLPLADTPCAAVSREVVLGFVGLQGPAVLDGSGSRGSAQAVVFDSATKADGEAPVSRCSFLDWDAAWRTALMGQPPVQEPALPIDSDTEPAACSGAGDADNRTGDPVLQQSSAHVDCQDDGISGYGYVRGFGASAAHIGEALSSFRIYRDPARGVVSRVESVARGVAIPGVLRIDSVRGVAESWANGRRQPVSLPERPPGYVANCDFERTAGTCFQRHIVGLWTPGYQCGPCGDETALADRLSRTMGTYGAIRLRHPDAILARGNEAGSLAAIAKSDDERFSDLTLNNDLLETVVPAVEIVRYAPPNRVVTSGGPRGRQIIQLAGVEVSSSYAIQCLLVYDEATNTCGAQNVTPGSLVVTLHDPEERPLPGGTFHLHMDVDQDGVLGVTDTLLPDGVCTTAADGIGTCRFAGLGPGDYLISQVGAPTGYQKVSDPFALELGSGEERSVTFTNMADITRIVVQAEDGAGRPLPGASFALYADQDSDGRVSPGGKPVATCTTDAQGSCDMAVPAGSYVLVQTGAPDGLEGVPPIALTLASSGQVAAVSVVNVFPGPSPSPVLPKIAYLPPSAPQKPLMTTTDSPGSESSPTRRSGTVPERFGGTVVQVIRAPSDALRLLARHPGQAIAWNAAFGLLLLAALAVHRRSRLRGIIAFVGTGTEERLVPPARERPRAGAESGGPTGSVRRWGEVARRPPIVAGAAPRIDEARTHIAVLAATASPVLKTLVRSRLLDSERCRLVGVAGTISELRGLIERLRPDILVIDLALRTGSSADACDLLPGLHPIERTVGLIPPGRSHTALASRGFAAGLRAMLGPDDLTSGDLAYAVNCLAEGRPFFGPTVQAVLLEHVPWGPQRPMLSERELQVALLAAEGIGRVEIAQRLFLSPWTVKRHMVAVRAKLGVTDPYDRAQLRRRLVELGLVDEVTGEGPPEPRAG